MDASTSRRGPVDAGVDRLPGRPARARPRDPRRRADRSSRSSRTAWRRGGRRRVRAGELLERVGLPPRRARRLPARVLGRSEAARDDRDGARVLPRPRDRGRAHHGTRRHGAGAGPAAAPEAPRRPGSVDALHHARPVGARGCERPARRHVCGAPRGGGSREAGLHAPQHPYTKALAAAFPAVGDERFIQAPSGLGAIRLTLASSRAAAPSTRGARSRSTLSRGEPPLFEVGEGRRAACLLVPPTPGSDGGP